MLAQTRWRAWHFFFSTLVCLYSSLLQVVDTVKAVKMTNVRGEVRYPIKVSSYFSLTCLNSIFDTGQSALLSDGCNVLLLCLIFGGSIFWKLREWAWKIASYLFNGHAAQGMPMKFATARIACLNFNLQKTKMQLGVQVLVNDPTELEKIRQRWLDYTLVVLLKNVMQ